MIHFRNKPARTLIPLLALFMTAGLLGSPVYAEGTEVENNPSGAQPAPTETDTVEALPANGHITPKLPLEPPADLEKNKGDLTVDVYMISEAVKDPNNRIYTYPAADGYAVAGYDLSRYKGTEADTVYLNTMNREKWEAFTQEIAKIVRDSTTAEATYSGDVDAVIPTSGTGLKPGLYLVLAHGKDVEKSEYFEEMDVEDASETEPAKILTTTFTTPGNKYYFRPVVVAVPSTNTDTSQEMSTDSGDWVFDLDVYLKPEVKSQFGKLTINKEVTILEDRLNDKKITPMTAAFRITGWKDDTKAEKIYSNVASITVPDGNPVTIDRLPVGAYVEVEEIYTGAGYKLVDRTPESVIIPSPEDEEAAEVSFTFTNTYRDELKKGYGVMNSFTKIADSGDKTWEWKNDLSGSAEGETE